MGSDLHMNPPTPDEYRIVRAKNVTAVYSRHTDGIYGDTSTWHRRHIIDDPTEAAFESLKATHKDWRVVTMSLDDPKTYFAETLYGAQMNTPDRDWDAEEVTLISKVTRAKQKVEIANDERVAAEIALQSFRNERKQKEA